jgi:hypothetical protein
MAAAGCAGATDGTLRHLFAAQPFEHLILTRLQKRLHTHANVNLRKIKMRCDNKKILPNLRICVHHQNVQSNRVAVRPLKPYTNFLIEIMLLGEQTVSVLQYRN